MRNYLVVAAFILAGCELNTRDKNCEDLHSKLKQNQAGICFAKGELAVVEGFFVLQNGTYQNPNELIHIADIYSLGEDFWKAHLGNGVTVLGHFSDVDGVLVTANPVCGVEIEGKLTSSNVCRDLSEVFAPHDYE